MSARLAAGSVLLPAQSVSVVPMIQYRPQGMMNSTLSAVRAMIPVEEWIAVLGHDQVDALGDAQVDHPAPAHHRLDLVGPHAGRVDHLLGPDLHLARRSPGPPRAPR